MTKTKTLEEKQRLNEQYGRIGYVGGRTESVDWPSITHKDVDSSYPGKKD